MKEILNVEGVKLKGKYTCSESATLTVRDYFKETEMSLKQLRDEGCESFNTVLPCLPEGYRYDSCTFDDIKKSVDHGKPVLISMIPDENIRRWMLFGEDPRHTVIIHGYDEKNYYIISDGYDYKVDRETLDRTRSRVGFACLAMQ